MVNVLPRSECWTQSFSAFARFFVRIPLMLQFVFGLLRTIMLTATRTAQIGAGVSLANGTGSSSVTRRAGCRDFPQRSRGVHDNALERGPGGGAEFEFHSPSGLGAVVPQLLVPALCLRPAARLFAGGRSGPDAGLLRASARTRSSGRSPACRGAFPLFPSARVEESSGK